MKESILLIGGGGHCKSCIDVIEQEGKYRIAGIVDVKEENGREVLGYPVIGSDDDLPLLIKEFPNVLITVGQIKSAAIRIKLYGYAKYLGAKFPVIISSLAYVSKHAIIGEGSIIMHHAIINAGTVVGKNCIVNSNALIEHEALIGSNCHISTGVKVNGQVKIGDECFIGSGVTIINNVEVCERAIVPAGITIFKAVLKEGIYVGR